MRILLLGLGRANTGVARYCIERGDKVFLYDDNLKDLPGSAQTMIEQGTITVHTNIDYDFAVTSPGFPLRAPIMQQLLEHDVPIIDEVEFTFRELTAPEVIAVTGTNGKSTTAAMIHSVMRAAGRHIFLGGNLAPGKPFSQALFESKYDYYILEVSSFQLMRIDAFRPAVAVLTNIAQDHMNWHEDMDEYRQAKVRIFENQTKDDIAVLNHDDPVVRNLTQDLVAQKVYFGESAIQGAHYNGFFCFGNEQLFPFSISKLPGKHNTLNILAVVAVAMSLNIDNRSLAKGIKTYHPLPHRLEDCGIHNGIRYINNSMCTNEHAAVMSFNAIPGSKVVILGGREKGDAALNYLDLLIKEAKACILLGENAPSIAHYFKENRYDQYCIVHTMTEAVKQARNMAESGDSILLNPGFASFGLFKNFEERGEAFKHEACKDR